MHPIEIEVNPELRRSYIFPNSTGMAFTKIVKVTVLDDGSHELTGSDGTKALVKPGWLALILNPESVIQEAKGRLIR
jgi:hypothetical protein